MQPGSAKVILIRKFSLSFHGHFEKPNGWLRLDRYLHQILNYYKIYSMHERDAANSTKVRNQLALHFISYPCSIIIGVEIIVVELNDGVCKPCKEISPNQNN